MLHTQLRDQGLEIQRIRLAKRYKNRGIILRGYIKPD